MFVFVGLVVSFLVSYLIEHTERISMGDVDQKIPIRSKDEIGRLAEAFERMRVSIKKVMDLLK